MFLALLVYVDDIILAGNDFQAFTEFKAYFNDCFRIKDLGPLKYLLGIEVARGPAVSFSANASMPLRLWKKVVFWVASRHCFPSKRITRLSLPRDNNWMIQASVDVWLDA